MKERHEQLVRMVNMWKLKIESFHKRMQLLGHTHRDTVIAVFDVNDPIGYMFAVICVGHSQEAQWAATRAAGQTPYCIGLVPRPALENVLKAGVTIGYVKQEAVDILVAMNEIAIVAIAYNAVGIFGLKQE